MRVTRAIICGLVLARSVRELPAQPDRTNPRAISASALSAAEQGTLTQWALTWAARANGPANQRAALFAAATVERLRYRHRVADSLFARVIQSRGDDAYARQSQLARLASGIVQGRQVGAPQEAFNIAQAALRHADTLTALDALLLRAGTVLRTEGPTAATSVLAEGNTLGWTREPALDAASRCRLAAARSRAGGADDARRLAREGEAIATRAGLKRQAASCAFILATEFARVAQTDSFGTSLLRAMDLQRRTGDLIGLASSNQWAGYYSINLGNFQLAQAYLATAWDAAQRAGSVEGKAWTALSRGGLALSFFDGAAAHAWLTRADSLMRTLHDAEGRTQVARLRVSLARATGDTTSVRLLLSDAASMADKLNEPRLRMGVLATQFDVALEQSHLDEAAELLRAEDSLITRHALTGWRLSMRATQAALALRQGHGHEAERLLTDLVDSLHPNQARFRHETEVQHALAVAMTGNVRRAAQLAVRAADSFDRWRASLTDSTLRLFTVQSQRANGGFMSALVARLADAGEVDVGFALTERRRARDLRDRLLLASAWQHPTSTGRQTAARAWLGSDSVDIGALQRAIPDTLTAWITMDVGEEGERGTAFVLTREALTAHALPSARLVTPRVRRLIALLESGRDAHAEARALGTLLVAPLLPRLERAGIARIVFIPEGILHRLPFEVLQTGDGRTLLERYETSVAPSVRVLAQLRARPALARGTPRVLALADPASASPARAEAALGARLLATVFGSRGYPALAGSRLETARVRRALPGTSIRAGTQARESMVKRDAATYDVLHFATHAVVDEWSGAQAALALTAGEGDDGLFESDEIASLRLRATLVVLSACRTVGGEVLAGEGVRGLTTAFLQAGALSVIATSWRVDDRAVAPLIGDLYDALARGASVGESLRGAQLAASKRGTSASVWGAFTIVGDATTRLSGVRP